MIMIDTLDFIWMIFDLYYALLLQGITKNGAEEVAIKSFRFTLDIYVNREAHTLALTNHKNVVKSLGLEKVLDQALDEKVLVMEYCPYGNLNTLIKSNANGLPFNECEQVFQSLANAVKHLRKLEIVHRDIKPLNILLSKYNEETVYKLADFGSARILRNDETYGSLYGTHEYIHPDIFGKYYHSMLNVSPKQQFNDTHELWSLGVTFYELVTGKLPFRPMRERDDPRTMFKMISTKKSGEISAKQLANGKISWSRKLPANCNLTHIQKKKVSMLLAGLLEV